MLEALKKSFLFRHLDKEGLAAFCRELRYKTLTYGKGRYVYDNQPFKKELGIILKGKIEVQKNLFTGKKVMLNQLKAGDAFGVAALFQTEAAYITSLLVKSEAVILFIEEEELLRCFALDRQLLRNYLTYVNQRIYFLNQRIECFTYEHIRERVVYFMEQAKIQQKNPRFITLPYTKCELADYLGISRASLYRVLKQLEQEKYFRQGSGRTIFFW